MSISTSCWGKRPSLGRIMGYCKPWWIKHWPMARHSTDGPFEVAGAADCSLGKANPMMIEYDWHTAINHDCCWLLNGVENDTCTNMTPVQYSITFALLLYPMGPVAMIQKKHLQGATMQKSLTNLPYLGEKSWPYCWWKTSQTTTWDVANLVNSRINYQPQLVSLPDFWTIFPVETLMMRSWAWWCSSHLGFTPPEMVVIVREFGGVMETQHVFLCFGTPINCLILHLLFVRSRLTLWLYICIYIYIYVCAS